MWSATSSCLCCARLKQSRNACHFDIKLAGDKPSGIVYRLLTTKPIRAHECKYPEELHTIERDLLTGKELSEQARMAAEIQFCAKLMEEWESKASK